jgi:hypothetical protein
MCFCTVLLARVVVIQRKTIKGEYPRLLRGLVQVNVPHYPHLGLPEPETRQFHAFPTLRLRSGGLVTESTSQPTEMIALEKPV